MIAFTTSEILLSLAYSAIYGAGFFVFFCLLNVFLSEARRIKIYAKGVISYDKILQNTAKKQGRSGYSRGSALEFWLVIFFFVGFIFLSYFALDGCFRMYMLWVSGGAFLACYGMLFSRLFALLSEVVEIVFFMLMLALRLLIFPFRCLALIILKHKK